MAIFSQVVLLAVVFHCLLPSKANQEIPIKARKRLIQDDRSTILCFWAISNACRNTCVEILQSLLILIFPGILVLTSLQTLLLFHYLIMLVLEPSLTLLLHFAAALA